MVLTISHIFAQTVTDRKTGSVTGLPMPRFVSLKAEEVNARLGPGNHYAIGWVFQRAGLPVEVLSEFENYRQVRDSEGATGWVAAALLSGRRTGIIAPWVKEQSVFDLTSSRGGSGIVAKIEPRALVDIIDCDGQFCEVYAENRRGFISQTNIWGVYAGEIVK